LWLATRRDANYVSVVSGRDYVIRNENRPSPDSWVRRPVAEQKRSTPTNHEERRRKERKGIINNTERNQGPDGRSVSSGGKKVQAGAIRRDTRINKKIMARKGATCEAELH